jgi:hypothetical protein
MQDQTWQVADLAGFSDDVTTTEMRLVGTTEIVLLTRPYHMLPEFRGEDTSVVAAKHPPETMVVNLLRCPPGSDMEWVYDYTLEEGLAEVDFFFRQRLVVDAQETLDTLSVRFPAHPEIERRASALAVWCSVARGTD